MDSVYSTRDISSKNSTLRSAKASAVLKVHPKTIERIRSGAVPKADPLGAAKVAGIQAAKQTSLIIPYCHQVPLDAISVEIMLNKDSIAVHTSVKAVWKTGVEMEALLAASASVLTLYDMLKIIDKEMEIVSVRLVEKKGGRSSFKVSGEGLTAAVIVLSDSVSKGEKKDVSGKLLIGKLKGLGFKVGGASHYKILPDDLNLIEQELKILADKRKVDLILTTGGTGVGLRDFTPEATLAVIGIRLEGVEEALRKYGQDRTPTAMLSRGISGIRGRTLIINLPGSPGGAEDGIDAVFPYILHAFSMIKGETH